MPDLDLAPEGGDGSLVFTEYGNGAQADVQDGHEDDEETPDGASSRETDEEYKTKPDNNDKENEHLKAAPTATKEAKLICNESTSNMQERDLYQPSTQ